MIKKVITNVDEALAIEEQVNGLMAGQKIDKATFTGLDVWYRNKKHLEANQPEKAELTIDILNVTQPKTNVIDLMSVAYGKGQQKRNAINKFKSEGKTDKQINDAVKVVKK